MTEQLSLSSWHWKQLLVLWSVHIALELYLQKVIIIWNPFKNLWNKLSYCWMMKVVQHIVAKESLRVEAWVSWCIINHQSTQGFVKLQIYCWMHSFFSLYLYLDPLMIPVPKLSYQLISACSLICLFFLQFSQNSEDIFRICTSIFMSSDQVLYINKTKDDTLRHHIKSY